MALSNDLISQFVKITNDDKETTDKETIVYGTTVKHEGTIYVKLDGSDRLTPISTTSDVIAGERVTVMIKNHAAIITGNITSPAARLEDVNKLADNINSIDQVVAYNVTTRDLDAVNATIENLKAMIGSFDHVEAVNAKIETLEARFASLDKVEAKDLEAINAEIEELRAEVAKVDNLTADDLKAINAEIDILVGHSASFTYVLANKLAAIDAEIKNADIKYANIEFTNIGKAAMEYFYAQSGLIDNVQIGDATIAGMLVGVTIKGDLIEGNTIVADKLVIKGEDGVYYKLNIDAETVETEQTEYNSLNGSIITAKSITASKITVEDLVAFGATIGGFNITDTSIYSEVKDSEDNTTRGIYFDKDGQVNIGDSNNYIKFLRDEDGTYKLAISAESIQYVLNGTGRSLADLGQLGEYIFINKNYARTDEMIDPPQSGIGVENTFTDSDDEVFVYEDENGNDVYYCLVEDQYVRTENTFWSGTGGGYIMDGVFTITNEQVYIYESGDEVEYYCWIEDADGNKKYYKVRKGVYYKVNLEPAIELGEADSEFKLIITNTKIMFKDGVSRIAHFSNESLHIKKAVIEEELRFGDFVWQIRKNGNMGLVWKGASE